ncbi:MAG TPA: DinB family protein [Chitinophagaceae bacterium]|nr:DinB family protein [Chitinophagaceae bacterium]
MNFSLARSIEILERTPDTLHQMLEGLPDDWVLTNEGPGTWSVYNIVGHLIEGEKTDWIPRMDIILSDKSDKTFEPFDRFSQFEESKGKSLAQLLSEFKALREKNLRYLRTKALNINQLKQEGIHPSFGPVSLSQLLSTWTVHDLNHIAQISRVMAKQYITEVGPWINFLKILQ